MRKPRVANGTYSHRLSGLIYCADCGARMGFVGNRSSQREKHYDCDSAFQCGNYRSTNGECVSHFVKTSALESVIFQAIKTVSKYVLENEAEFNEELNAIWKEHQTRENNQKQSELYDAKLRIDELDAKITKLYDSTVSGLLPERQAQRMIQQCDEEQAVLEKKIYELEKILQKQEVKPLQTSRFIALVKKNKDCDELTDSMLYEFIDRVEVHKAKGGRTAYRQQKIDVHFNFIGNYFPPCETISVEKRIAAIDAEREYRQKEKNMRATEKRKERLAALRAAAETGDTQAIAELEKIKEQHTNASRKRRKKLKEMREADPEYIRQLEEKERIKREEILKKEQERIELENRKKKQTRNELREKAKTDPEAAKEWELLKAKEKGRKSYERKKTRIAADPEYAAKVAEHNAESNRRHTKKRKAEHDALVECAKTDPEAIKQYEAALAKQRKAYYKKKRENVPYDAV